LAPRRLLGRLVSVLEAARQAPAPAPRLVAPPHQQHAPLLLNQHAAGDLGIEVDHKTARRAGRPHPAADQTLAQRGPTARAETVRSPLRVVAHSSASNSSGLSCRPCNTLKMTTASMRRSMV